MNTPATFAAADVRKYIDEANLAIHLAQNQLKQGLTARVEDSLDQALRSMHSMEEALSTEAYSKCPESLVREPDSGYYVDHNRLASVVEIVTEQTDFTMDGDQKAKDERDQHKSVTSPSFKLVT